MSRIAVVLFNLGGPDGPRSVRPFLKNLFSDPAIVAAPAALRWGLAELISRTRARRAIANYALMGGGSPLNAETQAQASALQSVLGERRPSDDIKLFLAMRYWDPLTEQAAADVAAFEPDDIVLLPLYPQFSTTTTASSLARWNAIYAGGGRRHSVCCYFDHPALVAAHADLIHDSWVDAGAPTEVRLLFSAHGLPERISNGGDPYRWQVERTCQAVAQKLGPSWDWQVCYQSRVGPMKWIGPSTVEAIQAAADAGKGVIVTPISFVSEHVETLVELDRDYAEAAERAGAAPYVRVPALGAQPRFIEGLADLVGAALAAPDIRPGAGACPTGFSRCALKTFCEAA